MSDTPRLSDAQNSLAEKPCRVIIDLESAKRMRAEIIGMKRAVLNIELNAKRFAEHAAKCEQLFSLITD